MFRILYLASLCHEKALMKQNTYSVRETIQYISLSPGLNEMIALACMKMVHFDHELALLTPGDYLQLEIGDKTFHVFRCNPPTSPCLLEEKEHL